ncbi:hypothetical protein [Sorangium sp. So ce233]|uniref:hypothetical protein n=1 Tax=Sorangium sp. So ce233 TaxID=3133290 RepID=UPI003F5FEAEC
MPLRPYRDAYGYVTPHEPVPLDGWEVAVDLRRELTRLPACEARPRGGRFQAMPDGRRGGAGAILDGERASARGAVYEVGVSGKDACVAGVTAWIEPERPADGASERGGVVGGGGKEAAWRAFARVDFTSGKAEGGMLDAGGGAPAPGKAAAPAQRGVLRRLACSLEVRPGSGAVGPD